MDLASGDGTGFGTFVFDVSWNGLSGTFEGRFRGILTGGVFCGRFIGGGTAGFEGMRINGTFCETGPETDTYDSVATIVNPRG